jgi:hypothetical protein
MTDVFNMTNYGFFLIHRNGDGKELKCGGVSCSQAIRKTHDSNDFPVENGTITFFYPTEWIIPRARNQEFLDYYLSLVEKFFCKVIHTGSNVKRAQLPIDISVNFINSKSEEILKTERNTGDAIFNDSWEVFQINIENNSNEKQIRNYLAYCMVRYLFSTHYQMIIDTFIYLKYKFKSYALSMEDHDFKCFQLAHYYYAGTKGFYSTYSIMPTSKSREDLVWKPLSLKEFNERITVKREYIHDIFKYKSIILNVGTFQNMVDLVQMRQIYESTK